VTDYYGIGKMITRINVPMMHHGEGHGTKVLAQILKDADAEKVNLYLEISPSDGLDYYQLEAWYLRHGFRHWMGVYRRKPK
jgi:predicted GNAT family N-acyltransferase